jgi:prolipoprotein diacylglyceryltransferase
MSYIIRKRSKVSDDFLDFVHPRRLSLRIDPFNCIMAAIIGGITGDDDFYLFSLFLGAKGHFALTHWDFSTLFVFDHGLSYQGGALGGGLAVMIYAKYAGDSILKILDTCGPLLPLGHAIGKIGCFLSGDRCYGSKTDVVRMIIGIFIFIIFISLGPCLSRMVFLLHGTVFIQHHFMSWC